MIYFTKILKTPVNAETWNNLVNRNSNSKEIEDKVKEIIENVQINGLNAVKQYTLQFDKVQIENFEVSKQEINAALAELTLNEKEVILKSIKSVTSFCLVEKQQLKDVKLVSEESSTTLRMLPLQRIGIYAPAGKSPLPSSVIMAAIPAKIAGVKELILCSPPQKDGQINKYILATASLCNVDNVYKIGGAQAIAALAYIYNVDLIAGPGNIYVTTAKNLVQSQGKCTIDMQAGPSEVLIIADNSADEKLIAADMLAQAEHGVTSASICITTNEALASKVANQVQKQLMQLNDETTTKSIEKYGAIIIAKDMREAIQLANEFSSEHVEIFAENAQKIANQIVNAGAIFINTAEVFGDYGLDSSNHILPTGKSARFSSGVSVQTFMKRQYLKTASRKAQQKWAQNCANFARMEKLEAHAKSAEARK